MRHPTLDARRARLPKGSTTIPARRPCTRNLHFWHMECTGFLPVRPHSFIFPSPFHHIHDLLIFVRLLRPSAVLFNSKHDRSLAYIFTIRIRRPYTTFASKFPPSFYQAIHVTVSFAFRRVPIHSFKTHSPCTILLIPPYLIPPPPFLPIPQRLPQSARYSNNSRHCPRKMQSSRNFQTTPKVIPWKPLAINRRPKPRPNNPRTPSTANICSVVCRYVKSSTLACLHTLMTVKELESTSEATLAAKPMNALRKTRVFIPPGSGKWVSQRLYTANHGKCPTTFAEKEAPAP